MNKIAMVMGAAAIAGVSGFVGVKYEKYKARKLRIWDLEPLQARLDKITEFLSTCGDSAAANEMREAAAGAAKYGRDYLDYGLGLYITGMAYEIDRIEKTMQLPTQV